MLWNNICNHISIFINFIIQNAFYLPLLFIYFYEPNISRTYLANANYPGRRCRGTSIKSHHKITNHRYTAQTQLANKHEWNTSENDSLSLFYMNMRIDCSESLSAPNYLAVYSGQHVQLYISCKFTGIAVVKLN